MTTRPGSAQKQETRWSSPQRVGPAVLDAWKEIVASEILPEDDEY
jgi:hypothetical protein